MGRHRRVVLAQTHRLARNRVARGPFGAAGDIAPGYKPDDSCSVAGTGTGGLILFSEVPPLKLACRCRLRGPERLGFSDIHAIEPIITLCISDSSSGVSPPTYRSQTGRSIVQAACVSTLTRRRTGLNNIDSHVSGFRAMGTLVILPVSIPSLRSYGIGSSVTRK